MAHKTKYGSWKVRWRDSGKYLAKTFGRKIDAEQFEAKLKLNLAATDGARELTLFEDFCEIWFRDYAEVYKTPSTIATDRQTLGKNVMPHLRGKALGQIKHEQLSRIQAILKNQRGLAPKTVNNILGLVRKILEDAMAWGYLERNPAQRLKRIPQPEQPFRFWTFYEKDRFLSWCAANDPWLYDIIGFVLNTGLRRGEVQGLLRDCLDFDRREIIVRRSFCNKLYRLNEFTKSKRIRRVWMNDTLLEILKPKRLLPPSGIVFPVNFQNFCIRNFRPAIAAAGVSRISFHDLRHTFASHLAMSGVDVFKIQHLLGHTDLKMTQRYMHLAPDCLAGSTSVLDKKFSGGPAAVPAEVFCLNS